jgi:hypothetical protein
LATEQGLVPYEEIDLAGIINNVRYILAESVNKSPITSDSRTHVLPRRLLEIVGNEEEPGLKVRLVETTPMTGIGVGFGDIKWIALSWRWGTGLTLKTEKGTLASHLKGIDFALLPKTFQDAVSVTHMLGVKYLWIDALCIIQDDPQDWHAESAIMEHNYADSYCTLAAHSARDWSTGFLENALARPKPIVLGGTDADGAKFAVLEPADFVMDVEHSHLSKRGWIVQERMLPSHILHFTKGQIHWESRDQLGTWTGRRFSLFHPSKPSRPPIMQSNSQSQSSPISWFNLVERYTDCALTQEIDKLIAIEGLARLTQESCGVPYLAGLWRDRLHTGLLWAAKKPMCQPTIKFRASSWSWACLEGPVQYPLTFEHRISEVAAPDIELLGLGLEGMQEPQDPTFVNSAAGLRLRADVVRVLVSTIPRAGRLQQRLAVPVYAKVGAAAGSQSPDARADIAGKIFHSLGDVAAELGLGCVTDPAQMRDVGYVMVEIVADPDLDEETAVRYVTDADTNPIGWAAMDEDGDAEMRARVEPDVERLGKVLCMKVATLTGDAPPDVRVVRGISSLMPPKSYVIFLEGLCTIHNNEGTEIAVCRRLGMGCIQGQVPFASAEKLDVLLL